ncbi:kinase-like domain-containing protein [Talaromyces proteolyticus]|uniref:Kinase-like domain-containing protein n=1 Tax=Talaromyces proteolyticus TaxID=1131652 RepID=A0AAD4KEZ0_9EURO|nr:kinase-like domain-containing protein [Talaromyces proteolyticus]KAH8690059.1 kinase-like domain-containing protein [Talaromyces proteolyticus]
MVWHTTWVLISVFLTIILSTQFNIQFGRTIYQGEKSEKAQQIFAPTCAVGTCDGEYRYLKQVGEGSYSTVLEAQSSTTGDLVAIKVFNKKEGRETFEEYIEKVESEFKLASQLVHPNIIRSLELRQEEETWLYIMESCETPLITKLLSESMTQNDISDVFVQLLKAVQYLHMRDIAHRDIKIHNILLCSDGNAKLIDFGEALNLTRAEGPTTDFVGTYEYIAPEMYRAEPYDALKADVWALAILFSALSLQEYPWHRAQMSDSNFSASVDNSFNALLARLPIKSRHVISHMLKIEPANRADLHDIFDDPWIQEISKKQMC